MTFRNLEDNFTSIAQQRLGHCQVLKAFFELVGQEDVEELSDAGTEEHDKTKINPWVTPREGAHKKSSKVEARQKEMTRSILSGVLKALLNHADVVISTTLQGTIEMDGNGDAVIDSVTQRPRVNERSGIMVRVDEKLGMRRWTDGDLNWLVVWNMIVFFPIHWEESIIVIPIDYIIT